MKTRLLIIIALVGFLSLISIVQAVPMITFDDAYDYSELVIVGQIESVEILSEPYIGENISRSGIALYDVTILFSLKNPDNITEITVAGKYLREPHPMAYETHPFEVGQVVILFIQPADHIPDYDLIIRSSTSEVIYSAIIYPNGSVGDGCESDHYSYYNGYCIRTEIQNYAEYNEFCNIDDDLKNQEELIKDDIVLIEFLKVLHDAELTRATAYEEPVIPQTSMMWSMGPYSFSILIDEYDENNLSDCFFPVGYRLNAPHLPEMIGLDYHKDPQIVLDQIDELEPKYVKGGPAIEPEPSIFSDEQDQMLREYCETGIRHPDMIGIPQCIKNELVCGPGAELVDGICMVTPTHPVGSDASLLPFVGGSVLVFGIIGLVGYYIWRKRK